MGNRGRATSPTYFIGEAPGADEDACGLPFVGQSGKLADKMLKGAGFDLEDVCFTNPYKVRPPNNEISRIEELGIPRTTYENAFFEELEATRPTIIIPAGVTPLSLLCPECRSKRTDEIGIGKWRGSLLTSPRLNWPHYVVPIYHPAYILRDWSEHDTNVFVLSKIKEELDYWRKNGFLQPLPKRELIHSPTETEALEYLEACLHQEDPISIDIELLRLRVPYTISFARDPFSAISVGFWDYSPSVTKRMWRLIDSILRTKNQIGQNYTSFDCHWLYHLGFSPNTALVDDTRVRHNLLWPELSHKLEFMCMQYTREPYYKEEGRGWTQKDGAAQLKKYNCKDTCVTYEVFNEQEKEFADRKELHRFYLQHERPLASRMFEIEKRGILTSPTELDNLRKFIDAELAIHTTNISVEVQRPVVGGAQKGKKLGKDVVNLSSPKQVIALLKQRGLKVPKNRQTGNESVGEEQLNQMFAETNDKVLKEILDVRELNKILSTNVNCRLIDDVYYSVYIVGGTVGGRRASKANPLGFGGNGQNIPKHSKLGKKFRRCMVARPGRIFIQADQVAAEDWIINGIIADQTGDDHAIQELRTGTDRHQKLASYIFGVPLDQCSRDSDTIYRYVGKRTRYAGSYGMGGDKFAAVLAKEGFSIPKEHCSFLLDKFHQYDPGIRGVFQAYVEKTLVDTRMLRDLFGRERQFFGLHPYRDNSKIFREAYSYIPQSTIGDNNGAAINFVEEHTPDQLVMEVHDAIILEVNDDPLAVASAVDYIEQAYHRTLRFPRGYELEIPIEIEIGYTLQDMTRCENLTVSGLTNTYHGLQEHRSRPLIITGGAQQQSSVQV